MALSLKEATIKSKFLLLAALIFISLTIFSMLSMLLINLIYGINIVSSPDFLTDFTNNYAIDSLKLMQLLNSVGLFIIPSLVFAMLTSDNAIRYLHLSTKTKTIFFFLIPLLMICCGPLINVMAELNLKMQLPESLKFLEEWMKNSERSAEKITKAFLEVNTLQELFFNIALIAVIPAIGEELLFRGVIQKLCIQGTKNTHLGVWITAILFSAMHMQFFGFLPRMLMGALFGYLFVWTNNLWIPILAHFINNGVAVTISYLIYNGNIPKESENMGIHQDDFLFILLGAITVGLFLYFIYENRTQDEPQQPKE